MTVQVLVANRSSQFALSSSSVALGAGQDDHLPIGRWSGYRYRAAIGFPTPTWPAAGVIDSAILTVRTTGQVHVGFGSTRDIEAVRVTGSWTANGATQDGGGSMSSAATKWPGPSSSSSGTNVAAPATENTDFDIDVTAIVRAMAPTSMGGAGAAWLGFLLWAQNDASDSDTTEIYSAEATASSRPELTITYTIGGIPDAPVLVDPVGGSVDATTFRMIYTHPDGLEADAYDLQVRDGALVSVWALATATTVIDTGTNTITRAYAGTPLVTGDPYTWRARIRDTAGKWGAWSAWAGFSPGGGSAGPYDRWASSILTALAQPRPITRLGVITPIGPTEVGPIVGAEFGDRWQVVDDHVIPTIDRTVRVLGMTVRLKPTGVEVDAVTEEIDP